MSTVYRSRFRRLISQHQITLPTRRFLQALVGIACVALLPQPAQADLRQAMQAVYKVGAVQADRKPVVGSAVLVAPGKLITNCHTTREASDIRILHPQGELPAKAGKSDERRDLCLLLVPELRGPIPERVRSADLKEGTAVTAMGFGTGFGRAIHEGAITALFAFEGGFVLRTSAQFPRGASGGGLFDDAGRLVGVLTFRGSGGDALNYALPVEWVEQLLAEHDAQTQSGARTLAFWEDDAPGQPAFLRAAWLMQAQRWPELRALADEWVLLEPDNAHAWFALGRAESELGLAMNAVIALRNAVRLRDDHADAWYWLARAYRAVNYVTGFIGAAQRLAQLDAPRAAALGTKAPPPSPPGGD